MDYSQVVTHGSMSGDAARARRQGRRQLPELLGLGRGQRARLPSEVKLENATVRGRAWYKLLDAPVPTLDVTV